MQLMYTSYVHVCYIKGENGFTKESLNIKYWWVRAVKRWINEVRRTRKSISHLLIQHKSQFMEQRGRHVNKQRCLNLKGWKA